MENKIYTYIFVQKFNESIMASKDRIMSISDKKWQAEADARTMAEYQAIMESKSRMRAAQKAATEMAKDLTTRANQMNKVVNTSKSKKK